MFIKFLSISFKKVEKIFFKRSLINFLNFFKTFLKYFLDKLISILIWVRVYRTESDVTKKRLCNLGVR